MFTLYRLLLAVAFVLCAIGNVNADPSVFAINRTYKPSGPLQGGGSGGGAFGPTIYRPKGISLLGYQTLVMSGVHRTTALTVTDGPWGLIGVWTKCSPDSTGSYSCNLAEIGNTRANWATCSTACSSEQALGVDIMFDTAGSPSPQAAFRVNLNAAGSTSAPQVGGYISNVFTAADYGTWIHWAVAWDTSMAGTKCLAVYKNGINLNINQPYYAAAININTSNANGFTVGYDDNFNQAPLSGGNRSFSGDLAEFYANFSQDAFTSTPCIGGGSIPPSMLAGLIAGTGSSVKPVNMKTTCSAVTGLAPTICLRGNAGNFANNSGTGGAFVNQGIVNDSEYGPPTIPNDHVARLKWRYIIGVVNGTTLSYGDYATVPGDLLVLAVTKMQSSAGAATATVPGFTQLSCGGGTSSNDMMQCIFYRIATSAGEAPPAITFTGAVRSAQASILVYGNATGIGAAGSWVVIDPSSATSAAIPGITPTQSNSTIVTTAFTYDSRSSPYSFTGNTYSLKYDGSLYAKGSSMFPETYIGDFINSGLTAVPATTFHTTGADNLSGLTFEILHN